ncbi:MAG: hypothetical protein RLZZ474_899, partial [Bacteroidota bacterium]
RVKSILIEFNTTEVGKTDNIQKK